MAPHASNNHGLHLQWIASEGEGKLILQNGGLQVKVGTS
jgi:hypothetical protein